MPKTTSDPDVVPSSSSLACWQVSLTDVRVAASPHSYTLTPASQGALGISRPKRSLSRKGPASRFPSSISYARLVQHAAAAVTFRSLNGCRMGAVVEHISQAPAVSCGSSAPTMHAARACRRVHQSWASGESRSAIKSGQLHQRQSSSTALQNELSVTKLQRQRCMPRRLL